MGYLKRIEFHRYKRLDRFTFSCAPANILVGPNNAGKSSILDALRVMQGVQRYARRLRPTYIRTARGETIGYEVPDNSIPINIANVVNNYGDSPAIIDFIHDNGRMLSVEMHPTQTTKVYLDDYGRSHSTGRAYFDRFPVEVVVVPTLSPFEVDEPYVADETVDRNRGGRLAYRHFRNLWYRSTNEEFNSFYNIINQTWADVSIRKAARPPTNPTQLEMFYREGIYDREIAWSGFGFQVWLQIVTHMLRGSSDAIFVLDEPDIYLHPDLQSEMLNLVRSRFKQFFLATHSTEIINRATPGDIVSVNSRYRSSKRVKSDEEYNQVYSYIGSVENVELSKLSRAKRVIFFEGKDKSLLSKLSLKAGFYQLSTDAETLVIGVGGFGQWRRVVEAAWTFRNVLQVEVSILALFDRDYRDDREVEELINQVSSEEVRCLVWKKKEIENYLLVPRAIVGALQRRAKQKGIDISTADAMQFIDRLSDLHRHDVHGQIVGNSMAHERRKNSHKDSSDIVRECSQKFEPKWIDLNQRLGLIPGKQFISDLSTEAHQNWGFSITQNMICDELRFADLDPELVEIAKNIDEFCIG